MLRLRHFYLIPLIIFFLGLSSLIKPIHVSATSYDCVTGTYNGGSSNLYFVSGSYWMGNANGITGTVDSICYSSNGDFTFWENGVQNTGATQHIPNLWGTYTIDTSNSSAFDHITITHQLPAYDCVTGTYNGGSSNLYFVSGSYWMGNANGITGTVDSICYGTDGWFTFWENGVQNINAAQHIANLWGTYTIDTSGSTAFNSITTTHQLP